MSQTPTNGPFEALIGETYTVRDEDGQVAIFTHMKPLTGGRRNPDDVASQCRISAEALNIRHETKQTPRQIFDSREALRAALADLVDLTETLLMSRECEYEGSATEALAPSRKALTLAKEGGPK